MYRREDRRHLSKSVVQITDPGQMLVYRCRTCEVGLLLSCLFAVLLQRRHGQEDALQQPDALWEAAGETPAVAPPTATPVLQHQHFFCFRNFWRRKKAKQWRRKSRRQHCKKSKILEELDFTFESPTQTFWAVTIVTTGKCEWPRLIRIGPVRRVSWEKTSLDSSQICHWCLWRY